MIICHNIDLKEYNSYKISSKAEVVYFPENVDDFKILFADDQDDNYFIIGGGNNIILASEKYENKKIVIISKNFSNIKVENNKIKALSGTSLRDLGKVALDNNLSGLEIFYDIPGSLGGAMWMNAGAYGESFLDLVEEVEILDKTTGKIVKIASENIERSYRYSQFQDGKSVILSGVLSLAEGKKEDIESKMYGTENKRSERFPKEYPSAGSVFKRPPDGLTVGEMVERLGLKGYCIGGAKVSEKHGGFIVNYNCATAKDILDLAHLVMDKVYNKYEISLEMEQIIVVD